MAVTERLARSSRGRSVAVGDPRPRSRKNPPEVSDCEIFQRGMPNCLHDELIFCPAACGQSGMPPIRELPLRLLGETSQYPFLTNPLQRDLDNAPDHGRPTGQPNRQIIVGSPFNPAFLGRHGLDQYRPSLTKTGLLKRLGVSSPPKPIAHRAGLA